MSLQNRINKTAQKIETITQKMRQMEAPTVKTQAFTDLEIKLQKAQLELQKLRDEQAQWESMGISSGGAWDKLCEKIGQAEDKVFSISGQMDKLKSSGEAFSNQTNTKEYEKLNVDLANANEEMGTLKQRSKEMIKKLGKASIDKLVKGFKKLPKLIGGAISKLKKLHSGTKKTNGGFSNLLRTMKQMVLSMAVFQVMFKGMEFLKSGLQNLAVYSKDYNKQMSDLVSSTGMLKNSLAVAFAPILSAVIPYLVKLIDWVSAAANALSRFFAILSGKSFYTKAKKQNENYADSLNKVGGAADRAKGSLAGFDDLDVLQKNDASGGGGGASGGADGSGFEEESVGVVSDWAQSFKDAVDAGDWYGIGLLVAQKISEALAAIDWGFIQDKAAFFATNLALALNGFVDGMDWNLLGGTIGNGITTALIFAFTFLTTFNFMRFGQSIATGLNGAIKTTDFSLIGATLGSALMAIFNSGLGFVTTFDWFGLGLSISEGINSFFETVDWESLGLTASGLILGLLETINTALEETDWNAIGSDVATFLGSIDWGGIFGALGEGVLDVLTGINDFLLGVIGNEAAVGVLEGIAVVIGILATSLAVYNGVMAIYNIYTTIAAAVTSSLFAPILLIIGIITALIAVGILLYQNWDVIKEKAVEIWNAIVETITNFINGIKETITNIITSIKDTWDSIWNKIKEIASTVVNGIKTTITNVIDKIKSGISNTLNAIKETWNNIWTGLKTTVTDIFNGIWNAIKGVINSILGGIESMANGVIKGVNKIISALNGLSFDIPSWVPVFGGNKFGFSISEISEVKLPRLANGGTTTGSTLANIGEAGKEAVLPLERDTGWADILADKITSRMPDNGTPSTLIMEVDGREFARVNLPYFNDESQRIGVSLVTI